jgi:hypothetical protein
MLISRMIITKTILYQVASTPNYLIDNKLGMIVKSFLGKLFNKYNAEIKSSK